MQANAHVFAWYFVGRMMWLRTLILKPEIAIPANAEALERYRRGK